MNPNEADQAIDRLLRGLAEVAPPPAMEERVIQRIALYAPRKLHTSRWLAACAFATALLIAVLVLPHNPQRKPNLTAQTPARHTSGQYPDPHLPTPHPEIPPAAYRLPARRNITPAEPELHFAMRSFPAPPLPLTDQERLLVQVALRGKPAQLPVLDPEALAEREAQSEADFEAALAANHVPAFPPSKP